MTPIPTPTSTPGTLPHAKEMLAGWYRAEQAAQDGRSVTFNGRNWQSQDLAQLGNLRREWEQRVHALTYGGGPRFGRVTFE